MIDMGPKEKANKKRAAVVVAAPIEVEAEGEMTADQLRYIAEPWFTETPQGVMDKARNIKWDQGVGGNHAVVNLAKKEMIRQNVEGRAWRQRRREVSGRGACAAMPF